LTFPLRVAVVILIIGALFKVMHWPYSQKLMFIGGIAIGVLYVLRFLYKKSKQRLDYIKLAIVLLWVLSYLVKAFHLYNIPYIIEICILVLFIWWLIEDGFNYFKRRKFKKRGLVKIVYYLLFGFASAGIIFGSLFKIQHWPYGSELFVLGTLTICALLIIDYFVIERAEASRESL